MKPSTLLKLLLRFSPKPSTYPPNFNAGFSLVELFIVVLIIGILSAIAAPGWNAFITRQRIRTVNDGVFRALKSGQSQAKLQKADRVVQFRDVSIDAATNPSTGKPYNDPPRFQIYSTSKTTPIPNSDPLWQSLGANGEIKAGMVKLVSGVCNSDCTTATGFENNNTDISFNYLGTVDSQNNLPFAVTISTQDDQLIRCVIVETLLGGMRTAEGANCPI